MDNIIIHYSHRRSLALKINAEGILHVYAPKGYPLNSILDFVTSKSSWIQKHQKRILAQPKKSYKKDEIIIMKKQLFAYAEKKITEFANTNPDLPACTGLKITTAKNRWGSCNSKNSICLSAFLAEFLSDRSDFVDAVIAHEMAHLKEKNHSPRFYRLVFSLFPEYQKVMKKYKNQK